ncbi:MAG: RHS repeat protein [Polyangiaceae bacterium]|nr:RHS repeat protein [Polyangiaceae bacterium]
MSGGFMLRMLRTLCAALALVVSPGLGSAAAQAGSEDGAPSICAQRRPQPVIAHASAHEPPDAFRPETPARAQIRRGQAGAQRRAAPRAPPRGRQQGTYDADGRLASVTDPLAKTESYTYSAAGDLSAFQDRKSRTTSFGYDQLGRPSTTTDPANRRGTFAYPVPVAGAWTGAAVFAGSPDTQAAPTALTASLRDGEYQIGLREHRAGGYPAQVEFYRDATFELSFGRSFDGYGRLKWRQDRVGLPFASGTVFPPPRRASSTTASATRTTHRCRWCGATRPRVRAATKTVSSGTTPSSIRRRPSASTLRPVPPTRPTPATPQGASRGSAPASRSSGPGITPSSPVPVQRPFR